MSHFTVMVLLPREPRDANDADGMLSELLAPFNEDIQVEPYKEYLGDRNPKAWPWVCIAEGRHEGVTLDSTDAEIAAALSDEDERYGADEGGVFRWSTYNPQSKWDWWALGGRWTGFFPLKPDAVGIAGRPGLMTPRAAEGSVDVARKGDIDFIARAIEAERNAKQAWAEAQKAGWLYGIRDGEDQETFVRRRVAESQSLHTYAVLAEGVWREPGKMGWFGCSAADDGDQETYDEWAERFIAALPDDAWLAVVDCHI